MAHETTSRSGTGHPPRKTVDWAVPRTLTQAKLTPANLDGSVLILGTCCTCTNEH